MKPGNWFGVCLVGVICFSLAQASSQGARSKWLPAASRLSSESPSERQAAARELGAIPDLDRLMSLELRGENQSLALVTVGALRRVALLPELLKLSRSEPEGFVQITINSLIGQGRNEEIEREYRERVSEPSVGAGAKLAMLHGLRELGVAIESGALGSLLKSENPQARIGAVQYARHFITTKSSYEQVLRQAASMSPFQLRVEAIRALAALPPEKLEDSRSTIAACMKDGNEEVREACDELRRKASSK